jgi:SAM-dependent methyltransferase
VDLKEARATEQRAAPRHPWERARLAFVIDLLRRHAPDGPVLDVGAGDGFVARALHDTGRHVVAVDDAFAADDIAGLAAAGVAAQTTLPTVAAFRVALLLDVIEHVDDDVALLRAAADSVDEGGVIVVTVPAWPALFSSHDRALAHRRRYTPPALADALHRAGLEVVEGGGLFHTLLLPRAVSVWLERRGPRVMTTAPPPIASFPGPPVVADLVVAALRAEQHLSRIVARRRPLPRGLPGLSCYAVAKVHRR